MTNRTIDALVTITPETEIEVTLQDSIDINIDTPMLYIQSGKDDIDYFVKNEALPQLEQFIKEEAEPLVNVIINEIAEPTVIEYVENTVKPDILEYSETKKGEIQETIATAEVSISASVSNASENAALASESANQAEQRVRDSRIWATGEDAEVDEIAPGEEEHSSRGYADLAMAIANTPEDVPVDMSKLLALDVIKVPVVDLEGYVKNTDYAGDVGGVIKISAVNGLAKSSNGYLLSVQKTLGGYNSGGNDMFVSKGTLENIKNDLVKRAVTANDIELTEAEKTNAKAWLGYADNNDIIQAIASISQFKIAIVDALPTAGEAKTLYLVPKEGTDNDVYNEYLWLEQDSKFEFLGTTAVDLTDYVKNTDYAQGAVGGVVKTSAYYGVSTNAQGFLLASQKSLSDYDKGDNAMFVAKGTLTNVLTQYAKTVLITEADYEALETKDTNTLYLIEEE